LKIAHHPLIRKGMASLRQAPRAVRRATARPADYRAAPPVLCNSFPKSGTHLLLQILAALPGVRSYGSFIASVPSVPFRLRSPAATGRRIGKLAPGELAAAHLYWSAEAQEQLAAKHATHYFIYRDPRAVVVSEMHYLAQSAWWHGLHRRFARLPSDQERLLLSIRGCPEELPEEYPDIRARFEKYAAWIKQPQVCAVRYEDLRGEQLSAALKRIVDHYLQQRAFDGDREAIVETARAAIRPQQSHTFRRGDVDAWREAFTPCVAQAFDEVAGDLLQQLGYAN